MSIRVEVETRWGRLRGLRTERGVCRFLGVPFAAPPTGARRFLAPELPPPWSGVRDALHFAASAPQRNTAGPLGEMIGIAPGATSEDCLYLNVWTPGVDGRRRPVLVWVHGGGNVVGSGAQPRMDGERLAERGDVVVVTFNYRLGVLGFLLAPEIGASGNQALLDQVAALRWVRGEIGSFGGDPSNVTVFGQSAGGFDITELMAMASAEGCFDKAIPMSGSLRPHVLRDPAEHTARVFAEPFGGLAKLREAPVEALLDRQVELTRSPLGGEHRFAPTRDGELIRDDAASTLAAGRFDRGIPLLLGTTRHEWNLFSAFDSRSGTLDRDALRARIERRLPGKADAALEVYEKARAARGEPTDPLVLWNAFMTDESFRMPAVRLAELHAPHTPATFLYRFDRESPALDGRLGACHSIDVPFVFGTHRLESLRTLLGDAPEMDALSDRVMDVYVAFARTGSPAIPELPAWPRYSADSRSVMLLDAAYSLADDPGGDERRVWDGIPLT